ncbi:hypothetical protein K492DRAFT_173408 [Lichtheimia hyalospora FSU 10163]|nr:hypothetical protein K492DRAFT_173408 [Lichtheimia hyalospora FSU 10163]
MIGPSIPQELLEKKQASSSTNDHSPSTSPQHSPPPTSEMAGPMLPPDMTAEKQQEESDDDADAFTPALPPDLLQARQEQKQEQQPQQRRRRAPVGPSLPGQQGPEDQEDDFAIGPVLPSNYDAQRDAVQSTIQEVEERLESDKTAMEEAKRGDKNKKVERGEWMLVPPEIDYLRGADSSRSRGFNQRNLSTAEKDRSVWTDTPADRQRKQESDDTSNTSSRPLPSIHSRYDDDVRRNVQQYNNTERSKSLMEIHREMGGRKRKEQEDVASRPFDREKDFLKTSRPMDKRQKKEMMRKVGELGNRFGSGSSSFL